MQITTEELSDIRQGLVLLSESNKEKAARLNLEVTRDGFELLVVPLIEQADRARRLIEQLEGCRTLNLEASKS